MRYREEVRDLFSVPEEYGLVHCISADFAMGKGIVVAVSYTHLTLPTNRGV